MKDKPVREEKRNAVQDIMHVIISAIIAIVIFSFCMYGCYVGTQKTGREFQKYRMMFPYIAEYGDFWGGGTHEFYSYEIKDNRYIFYDKDKNLIGEFFVTENSKISIRKR